MAAVSLKQAFRPSGLLFRHGSKRSARNWLRVCAQFDYGSELDSVDIHKCMILVNGANLANRDMDSRRWERLPNTNSSRVMIYLFLDIQTSRVLKYTKQLLLLLLSQNEKTLHVLPTVISPSPYRNGTGAAFPGSRGCANAGVTCWWLSLHPNRNYSSNVQRHSDITYNKQFDAEWGSVWV